MFVACCNLIELNLARNSIFVVPAEVGSLSRLKSLDLTSNRISGEDLTCLPTALFAECPVIDITLTNNQITPTQLGEFEGFEVFLERRTKLKKKDLAGGALTNLGVCGLN